MTLTSDFELYYPLWEKADNEICNHERIGLFKRLIDLYIVACAIGVQADSVIKDFENKLERPKTIGRNTYLSMENTDLFNALNFMLKNAILTSKTVDLDQDERISLAFDPEYENKKLSAVQFLNGFANYGLKEIYSVIEQSDSMAVIDKIYNYLIAKTESNYEELLKLITLEDIKNI